MCVYTYRESIILFRNLDLEISTEITVSKKLYKKILDPQIWFLDIRFYVQNFYDRSDSNLLAIRSIPSLPRIKYSSLSTIDNIFLCSTILNQIKMKVTCSISLAARLFPSLLKIFRSINRKRGWNRFFSAILSNLRALQKNRENGTNLVESNSSIGRKILRKQFFERTIDKFPFKDSSFHVL